MRETYGFQGSFLGKKKKLTSFWPGMDCHDVLETAKFPLLLPFQHSTHSYMMIGQKNKKRLPDEQSLSNWGFEHLPDEQFVYAIDAHLFHSKPLQALQYCFQPIKVTQQQGKSFWQIHVTRRQENSLDWNQPQEHQVQVQELRSHHRCH